MINNINYLVKKYRNFILYGIIGVSGALIDLLFYLIFYYGVHITPSIASFLSVSVGILNNFIINSRYNFNVNDKLARRFLNFYLIGLTGAVASALIIFILYNKLGIDATIAKISTIPPIVLIQYFLNKKLSFQEDHKDLVLIVYSFIKRNSMPLIVLSVISAMILCIYLMDI